MQLLQAKRWARRQASILASGIIACFCCIGSVWAQSEADLLSDSYGEAGTQEGTFLETDSALGTFTIGVSGLSDSERRQATTGDLEVGYVQLYELDQMFPRVIELRPFALNRFETAEDSTYQSLGLGGGIRLSLRQKYNKNYGFIRGTVVTPTEYYNEFYNADRERSSIVELFVGFEVPFNDARTDRDIVRRTLNPYPVMLTVDPQLLRATLNEQKGDEELAQTQALLIRLYLRRALQEYLFGQGGEAVESQAIDFRNPWDVIRFLEMLTEVKLSEVDALVVYQGRIDGKDGQVYRKELTRRILRQGLTELMRGPYPLLFKLDASMKTDEADRTTVVMSQPGMSLRATGAGALDSDVLIEAYIDWFVERYVRSAAVED